MHETYGIIVAKTQDGVIGVNNTIPWYYPLDFKRFKQVTSCGKKNAVIMGKNTYLSIGKSLPNRKNVVVSKTLEEREGIVVCRSIEEALVETDRHDNVWFIGGSQIYSDAIDFCDVVDITIVPDKVEDVNAVKFPFSDFEEDDWHKVPIVHPDDRLSVIRYFRRLKYS